MQRQAETAGTEAAELEARLAREDEDDLTAEEDRELHTRLQNVERGDYIDEDQIFAWLDAQA